MNFYVESSWEIYIFTIKNLDVFNTGVYKNSIIIDIITIIMSKMTYLLYRYFRSIKYKYRINPQLIFKQLIESQYWSREKIINFQLNQLNKLLLFSLNSSNYYRKILNGIELPLKTLEEFSTKIPHLTKEIVKIQSNSLRTEQFCSDFRHSTSGTSGDPTTIYTSGIAEGYREAGFTRFLNWWDIKPYDKCVRIVGRRATMKSNSFLLKKVAMNFKNRYDINVFDLDIKTIDKYYYDLKIFKPIYIRGYKSAIIKFAELLEQKKIAGGNFHFRVAIVTAEILLEKERQYIEKILNCRVANEYGSAEVGQIALECPNGSMHIFEEAVYLSTNENKDVFITEIHNDSMPLINYKINDKVILADYECECGRSSKVISQILGRDNDYILKPNGEKISAIVIIFIFLELDDIGLSNIVQKFKVIQQKNNFKIIVVVSDNYSKKIEEYIKKRFYEEIGNEILIEINLVDSIPRDESGKLRFFSRID